MSWLFSRALVAEYSAGSFSDGEPSAQLNVMPTPRASVGTHGICWKRAENGEHRSQLEDFLGWLSLNHGGQVVSGRTVNADFQDWLMVWPTQWTALQPLEMGKYQLWLQQHGEFSPVSEAA